MIIDLYFFGTVAYFISFGMLAYFFYVNYENAKNQAFISLESDAGQCNTVPITVTDTFLADNTGKWIGEEGFSATNAIYILKLAGYNIQTNSQYESMMNSFYSKLVKFGTHAAHLNLAENLVFWMTFIEYYSLNYPTSTNSTLLSNSQVQSFSLTGQPGVVFNVDHLEGRVSSYSGICPVSSLASYDRANHVMSTAWSNYSLFAENSVCTDAIYPQTFGYYPPVDDNYFNIKIDVESFSISLAVNLNIIPIQYLTKISENNAFFSYQNIEYSFGEYFDLRFSTMNSIYCIQNLTVIPQDTSIHLPQHLCMMVQGSTFALPVFNSFGLSEFEPKPCLCTNADERLASENELNENLCDEFNFLVGWVFYRNKVTAVDYRQIYNNLKGNITSDLEFLGLFNLLANLASFANYYDFNHKSYNASFYTVNPFGNYSDLVYQNSFDEFCKLKTGLGCSLVIFHAFDATSKAVSTFQYQLYNGSCRNTEAIPFEVWNQLVVVPPVQFTQLYYECYDQTRAAIVSALGIASGNAQIFLPILMFLILPFLYLILLVIHEVPPKAEYKEQEKEQVNAIFALVLLRLRDGKTRGIKKHGILSQLAKGMIMI
jgi:hypothetical protein